ncbi:MAG: hypothetical protein ACOYOQ_00190 [Microthrixaceae bacterium]
MAPAVDFDPEAPIPAPFRPPREWLESPPDWFDVEKRGLVQIDFTTGRVAALVAPRKECLLDGSDTCWTAPQSPTNYEFAHVGTVVTDDGDPVRIANVGGGVPHADPRLPFDAAALHYANTATRRMVGRFKDTEDGIVFLGSMWPGTTQRDAFECMASALSGDWRWIQTLNGYELVGAQLVNNPGFRPLPARAAAFSPRPAVVASASTSDPAPVFGQWREAHPAIDAATRLTRLTEGVAALLTPDEDLPPAVTAAPGRERGGTVKKVKRALSNAEFMARRRQRGIKRSAEQAVDKDGDGKVFDNTPAERPATAVERALGARLRVGKPVNNSKTLLRGVQRGDANAVSGIRAQSKSSYVPGDSADDLVKKVIGDRPDGADGVNWDAAKRYVVQEHSRLAKAMPGNKPGPQINAVRNVDAKPNTDASTAEKRARDLLEKKKNPALPDPEMDFSPEAVANMPGVEGGTGTPDDPIKVTDINTAAALLANTDYRIELERPDEVATLLRDLADAAQEAKAARDAELKELQAKVDAGDMTPEEFAQASAVVASKVPSFDLCRVSVPGTNLFCPDSEKIQTGGRPRTEMPQFATNKPQPGSRAEAMERNPYGWVEVQDEYYQHLRDRDVLVKEQVQVPASHMKASQSQINGGNVGQTMLDLENGKEIPGRVVVTTDNYIVDGHHRHAATVGVDYMDGKDDGMTMPVDVVDMPITQALDDALVYTSAAGFAPNGVDGKPDPEFTVLDRVFARATSDELARWSELPDIYEPVQKKLDAELARRSQNAEGSSMTVGDIREMPGVTAGYGTLEEPFVVSDVNTAAQLLAEGNFKVQLNQPDEIATLLDELNALVADAKAKGDEAPNYDLCRVVIPGTNVFCTGSNPTGGLRPRAEMPQYASPEPLPDSPAAADRARRLAEYDALPDSHPDKGKPPPWADMTDNYYEFLRADDVNIVTGYKDKAPSHMRVSQSELNGGKVAGITQSYTDELDRIEQRRKIGPDGEFTYSVEKDKETKTITVPGLSSEDADAARDAVLSGEFGDGTILMNNDGYIIDGHHRWAALVALQTELGVDLPISVTRVDLDIQEVLDSGVVFAAVNGIAPANAAGKPDREFKDGALEKAAMRLPDATLQRMIEVPGAIAPVKTRLQSMVSARRMSTADLERMLRSPDLDPAMKAVYEMVLQARQSAEAAAPKVAALADTPVARALRVLANPAEVSPRVVHYLR